MTHAPPRLLARVIPPLQRGGDYLLTVDCPFCGREHTHSGGADPDALLYGYRIAHCSTGNGRSYELMPTPPTAP